MRTSFCALAALLAALLSPAAAGNQSHTQMFLVQYDLTLFPNAVCNDGSAGAPRLASGMCVRRSR